MGREWKGREGEVMEIEKMEKGERHRHGNRNKKEGRNGQWTEKKDHRRIKAKMS